MPLTKASRTIKPATPTVIAAHQEARQPAGNIVTMRGEPLNNEGLRQGLKEHRIFEAMETVANTDDEKPNVGFGFLKGKLVFWNGKEYRPLTLRESVQLYVNIKLTGSSDGDVASLVRWLGMIADALPAEGQVAP